MRKLLGLSLFLLMLYAALLMSHEGARTWQNHHDIAAEIGLYGILSLAAGILIISGGLDLSVGSVVGLCATLLAMMMMEWRWPPALAMLAVIGIGAAIGLGNGLIVTKLGMQPFVVTLCGLFLYRGVARAVSGERQQGLRTEFGELKRFLGGDVFGIPFVLMVFLVLAGVATIFLHRSVYGRYLFALGSNERAARYSGIATERYKILGYILCSALAAFFSIFFLMQYNSATPSSTGEFMELYAIAAAVLGGCSLRGGEGMVLGMLIGTCILRILPNMMTMYDIPDSWNGTVFGGVLLFGAILDEFLRRRNAARAGTV